MEILIDDPDYQWLMIDVSLIPMPPGLGAEIRT